MTRARPNAPTADRSRRVRNGGPDADRPGGRVRRRGVATAAPELSDEELRALRDDNVDPDEVARVTRDAPDDGVQEASDHDRDTTRDRLEGLLADQDDDL